MATYVFDKAKEQMLGGGLSLASASIKTVMVDNTLFGSAISAATNANPINITTTAAHGLTTGDHVHIFDVLGNTAANGRWAVTVIDATHFTIPVAGNGAYTSGGYVVDLSNKEFLSDIPSGARVAISPAHASKTVSRGVYDAADVTLTSVAGAACQSLVNFIDTGTPTTSRLLSNTAGGVTGLPTSVNPGTVNIVWDNGADKIFAM